MTKVSVIIPTYNRKDYVQEAINSVLAQTYTDYEIIVVDDGSTDGTGKTLQPRYGNRIRYVWQQNQGESAARNLGIKMARGEFIAFLDSDDLWLPDKLAQQVAYLTEPCTTGMVFAQAWLIDEHGERYGDQPLGVDKHSLANLTPQDLYIQNWVSGPSTVLIRREVLQKIGGFDPQIRFGEDWDLWLRVAQTASIDIIATPLACIRRHRETQCYYPDSSEKIARILSDHLRLLGKAFDSPHSQVAETLRKRAVANQYLEAFVAEAHVGTAENAREYLRAAQSHAAELLYDTDRFGKLILNQMVLIIEAEQNPALQSGLDYVNKVVDTLHDVGAHKPHFVRKLYAEANATLGFWAKQHWGKREARPFLLNALRQDLRWFRNIGLVSTIVKSFFSG